MQHEDELLEREEFSSLLETRVLSQRWRQEYNAARPHGSLGYQTPAAFAATCPRADSAKPAPACRQVEENGGSNSDS